MFLLGARRNDRGRARSVICSSLASSPLFDMHLLKMIFQLADNSIARLREVLDHFKSLRGAQTERGLPYLIDCLLATCNHETMPQSLLLQFLPLLSVQVSQSKHKLRIWDALCAVTCFRRSPFTMLMMETMMKDIASPDPRVRMAAARAALLLLAPEHAGQIFRRVRSDPDPNVRLLAFRSAVDAVASWSSPGLPHVSSADAVVFRNDVFFADDPKRIGKVCLQEQRLISQLSDAISRHILDHPSRDARSSSTDSETEAETDTETEADPSSSDSLSASDSHTSTQRTQCREHTSTDADTDDSDDTELGSVAGRELGFLIPPKLTLLPLPDPS